MDHKTIDSSAKKNIIRQKEDIEDSPACSHGSAKDGDRALRVIGDARVQLTAEDVCCPYSRGILLYTNPTTEQAHPTQDRSGHLGHPCVGLLSTGTVSCSRGIIAATELP